MFSKPQDKICVLVVAVFCVFIYYAYLYFECIGEDQCGNQFLRDIQ